MQKQSVLWLKMMRYKKIHKDTRTSLYLCGQRMPSLSLLPPVLRCSGTWPYACERVFSTVGGWMHVSPAESGNMYAPQLHRSMHSPSLERECVASSPKVCVRACMWESVATLICKRNADLSIKAAHACVLPTDMQVIIVWFYCASKCTA